MTPSKTLMVVDDDRQVLRYLTDTLQEEGYNTVACERYQDAKGMLSSVRPDMLVTDIRLGAYNGLQLALYAGDRYPGIPVVDPDWLRGPDTPRGSVEVGGDVPRQTCAAGDAAQDDCGQACARVGCSG